MLFRACLGAENTKNECSPQPTRCPVPNNKDLAFVQVRVRQPLHEKSWNKLCHRQMLGSGPY